MRRSYHIALAGMAALLGSSAPSFAQRAVVPQGVIVSAVAQSDLRAILRDIQRGVPTADVLSRYDLTAEDLQRLEQLAAQLGIDDLRDFRRELRSIARDVRSGVPIRTVLLNRGLTEEQLENLLALAQRVGIDVGRVSERIEKRAQKAKRRPTDDDVATRGASPWAPGQLKPPGESARRLAPGQQERTGAARGTARGASTFAPGQQMLNGDVPDTGSTAGAQGLGGGRGDGNRGNGNGNGGPGGNGNGNGGNGNGGNGNGNGGGRGR